MASVKGNWYQRLVICKIINYFYVIFFIKHHFLKL